MNLDSGNLRGVWAEFQKEHVCSVDRMLCNPELRQRFLDAIRLSDEYKNQNEEQLLWGLVALRKTKQLPAVLK